MISTSPYRTPIRPRSQSTRNHRLTRLGVVALTLAAVAVSACSTDHDANASALSGVCAKVETHDGLPTCTALYPASPALRLPPAIGEWQYGAVTRDGKALAVSPTRSYQLSDRLSGQISSDTKYATTIYRAKVSGNTVTSLEPAMTVPDNLVLENTFANKIMVGQISLRQPDGSYGEATTPVALRVASAANDGKIEARILNTDHGATVNGQCVPRLPAGTSDPLQGEFTPSVELERTPSMHAPLDDEMVLAWSDSVTNMGSEFFPSVATLYGADDLGQTWTSMPHATPTSGPTLIVKLAAADQGTTDC